MANSRLIASDDLLTAGLVDQINDWADTNGFDPNVLEVSDIEFEIPNNPNILVVSTATAPQTITIPLNLTNWKSANVMRIVVKETGGVTLVGESGVSLLSPNGLSTSVRYSVIELFKIGTNEYVVRLVAD